MKKKYKILLIILFILIFIISFTVAINIYILSFSKKHILESTPNDNAYDCILILGCGVRNDGTPSHILNDRLRRGVELYKAGHHGSRTASNDVLLSVIKPKICVISGVAGDKYGFPHQETINRLASNGVNKVYMTMKKVGEDFSAYNGDIVVSSSSENGIQVTCSNDDRALKDTEWLIQNRNIPNAWKLVA